MTRTWKTKIDIPQKTREQVIELLQGNLADASDLQLQVKQAHWATKGPRFIAIHELFDDVYESIEDFVDDIAERIMILGGITHGTIQSAAKNSRLPRYPENLTKDIDHTDAVSTAIAEFNKHTRANINKAEELGDVVTADLLTEVTRDMDKWLWFVEAHLQE